MQQARRAVAVERNHSKLAQSATSHGGSQLAQLVVGGNVRIRAIGAGQDSDLIIQGSRIRGGG